MARIVEAYGTKLRLLIASCEQYLPVGYHWNSPDGGMFTWLTGPDDFDAGALLPAAIEAGVAYIPGNVFHVDDTAHRNTLRLSTGAVAAQDIRRGIKRLAAVLSDVTMAERAEHPVIGVWEVWAEGAPFDHHVMTFHAGGTMVQANPESGNPWSSDSIGMGVWQADGSSVHGGFLETRADRITRQAIGKSVISFALTVDGDRFRGVASAVGYDRAGTPIGEKASAVLRGERFVPPPQPAR
ncbi:hypothetical protein [Labedaea rhizosphaerae]|uniref:Aminotransferase class I and II n=1 Tax=Labedaea rhizosphaerae TaxID=598644 RepID=A0A4R6SG73_LABRH|nr:hypothetical protein [Labedaea rhizosphaerae]TDQ00695.1 hypothetical protein EV186_102557 [Labedaea rhizosphaerae]